MPIVLVSALESKKKTFSFGAINLYWSTEEALKMSTGFADPADENPDPNDDFTIVDEEVTITAQDGYVHVEDITDSDGDEVIIFDAADLEGNEIHGFDARDAEGHEVIGIQVIDEDGNEETIVEYLD